MQARVIEIAHEIAEHRFLVRQGPRRAVLAHAPWQAGDRIEDVRPIILAAGRPTSLRVRVELVTPAPRRWRLEGRFRDALLFLGHVDAASAGVLDVEVALQRRPVGFVALRSAGLAWRLVEDAPDGARDARAGGARIDLAAPSVELVWLPETAASTLARGVPLELVRALADALEAGQRTPRATPAAGSEATPGASPAASTDATEHALRGAGAWPPMVPVLTDGVFARNPPRYDVCSGDNHYTDVPVKDGQYDFDRVTLFLSRYLLAPVPPCNCYDIAAVLQFFLRCAGVLPVTYCFMNPFGYLAPADLIGIGRTNNPFFLSNHTEKIVPESDPSRTPFYNHAFCRIDATQTIADACAGPHPGVENPPLYVAVATDGDVPAQPVVERGTVRDITDHTGVVHVDTVVSSAGARAMRQAREFMARVGYQEPTDARAVACAWPDPLASGVLRAGSWRVVYEEILPGEHEVHRHVSLASGSERVIIDLFVARDSAIAQERFLALGSTHSSPGPIFDPVPSWPGHAAAVQTHVQQQRFLWLHHNVVCDVLVMHGVMHGSGGGAAGGPVDAEQVARWLFSHADAAVVDDLAPHRPQMTVAVAQPVVRVGARARIDVSCRVDHVVDFVAAPVGLRLVAQGDAWLELVGTAPARDTLVMTVIDPRTLIHETETIAIDVQP